jgi:DNA-binding CsgD family transcriptional regulator
MLDGVTLTGEAAPPGLVGRDPELLVVANAVGALTERRGGALAVVGPAGVGKSRLAREATGLSAGGGITVLTGRAVATGGSTPYRPLIEALAPWARTASPDDIDLGAHARAVDILVPGWAKGVPEPLSPVFVAEALLRLLPHVSGDAPVLLLVEDLHWADEETLAAIEYVADAAESLPLLLVGTARDDEGPIARRLIRALAARGAVRLVQLTPLDMDATRELAAMRLGKPVGPSLAELLADRAEGLPLFVEEILAALDATGRLSVGAGGAAVDVVPSSVAVLPDTVADTVAARLEGMPDEQRTVVETAALLGRAFDHELVVTVHGGDGAVAPALQKATSLGLMHEDPDRAGQLRFRHALLRDGVVASTFPPRRAQLAKSLLDLLLERDLSDDELAVAVDLAARAGDNARAARLALRRAMDAFELWAMGTAERGLAEAREFAGTDPDLLIEIDVNAMRVASIVGRLAVVMQLGQALLTRLDPPGGRHDSQLLETHLRLMQTLLDEEKWQEAQAHQQMAESLMAVADGCQLSRMEVHSSLLDRLRGDLESARARAVRGADLARPDDYQSDIVCNALLHEGRAWLPDVETARARWQESLEYAEAHGVWLWRARLQLELATLEADELKSSPGEVDIALADVDKVAWEYGAVETQTRVALAQARLHLIRGDVDAAAESLARAESLGIAGAVSRRARVELVGGIALLRGESPAETPPSVAVLAGLVADDVAAAQTAAAEVDRSVRRGALALFVDLIAADETSYGAVVDATALLPDLAAANERLAGAPLVTAFFTRLHATGSAEERDALHAAVATFDRLGVTRPADACRAMLRAAGVPLPRRPVAQDGVPEGLRAAGVTTREFDVLRLIAEGRTNKEVAEALYLSPRTVEKHVERLLLKTGAPNRTALAALARTEA